MQAIKDASPHRVFRTHLARIEVFQSIPSRVRGEQTPPGPHTHVLPKLLARWRTDPSRVRLPDAYDPVLHVYRGRHAP